MMHSNSFQLTEIEASKMDDLSSDGWKKNCVVDSDISCGDAAQVHILIEILLRMISVRRAIDIGYSSPHKFGRHIQPIIMYGSVSV